MKAFQVKTKRNISVFTFLYTISIQIYTHPFRRTTNALMNCTLQSTQRKTVLVRYRVTKKTQEHFA